MTIPRKYRKLFQDSIVVEISMTDLHTADLGVALKHTRTKRIASIYKEFPSLNQKQSKQHDSDVEAQDDEGNQGDADDDGKSAVRTQDENKTSR